jgi:hypothetical protein
MAIDLQLVPMHNDLGTAGVVEVVGSRIRVFVRRIEQVKPLHPMMSCSARWFGRTCRNSSYPMLCNALCSPRSPTLAAALQGCSSLQRWHECYP